MRKIKLTAKRLGKLLEMKGRGFLENATDSKIVQISTGHPISVDLEWVDDDVDGIAGNLSITLDTAVSATELCPEKLEGPCFAGYLPCPPLMGLDDWDADIDVRLAEWGVALPEDECEDSDHDGTVRIEQFESSSSVPPIARMLCR